MRASVGYSNVWSSSQQKSVYSRLGVQSYLPATTQRYQYPLKRWQVDPSGTAAIPIPSLRRRHRRQVIDGIDRTLRTGLAGLALHSACVRLAPLVLAFDNTVPSVEVYR
jgi:hypothetical protein